MKPIGPRSQAGAISDRKIATPSAIGTVMASATIDDTTVP